MALFDFLEQDPIREAVKETKQLLQVPVELIATTADSAAKAWNVLSKVGLSHTAEHEVLREICAYHWVTVIVAMNNARDPSGRINSESWNRDAAFLAKSVTEILSEAERKGHSDVQMLHPLVEEETAKLAVAYFCREQGSPNHRAGRARAGEKIQPEVVVGGFLLHGVFLLA